MKASCALPIWLAFLSATTVAQVFDEARDKTRVSITSTLYDTKTSEEGGCGTNGCRPDLIYDDSLEAESRWSCRQPLDPDSYQECAIFFNFHEPQHMAQIQISFYKGDERSRTVFIGYSIATVDDGDKWVLMEYTSTGNTAGFETITTADLPDIDAENVYEVSIGFSSRVAYNTWLSINEVKLEVYGVTCEGERVANAVEPPTTCRVAPSMPFECLMALVESNPNQACADEVEDRSSALVYLSNSDELLWDRLVNGKGVGLCNIRVAGDGEDTDLYAYTGVMQPEGNHGYPDGANAGYVSTPDWPSGSPGAAEVCADYEASYGESVFCGTNGRSNALAQMRDAILNAHCCLSY